MIRAIKPFLQPLRDELMNSGSIGDESWRRFVDLVSRRIAASGVQSRDIMLSLFGDPAPLREALNRLAPKVSTREPAELVDAELNEKFEKQLSWALKRGLGAMRAHLSGGTAHHAATWSRLDRISRQIFNAKLLSNSKIVAADRCDYPHFKDLLRHLDQYHSADRNLPRSIDLIEDYFFANCSDCDLRAESLDDDSNAHIDIPDMSPMDFLSLPGLAKVRGYLEDCMEVLPEEERASVEVNFKFGVVVPISTTAYCESQGIERRRFYRTLDRGLEHLRDCIEDKLGAMAGL